MSQENSKSAAFLETIFIVSSSRVDRLAYAEDGRFFPCGSTRWCGTSGLSPEVEGSIPSRSTIT